jgi:Integrase core domain
MSFRGQPPPPQPSQRDLEETFGRVAALVDRILKGAKPAELPFEQPTHFKLVIPVYGDIFIRRLRAMDIRDRPTAAQSPWQNGYAERLIGSIRRECLDYVVVFGERHLRHLLKSYQRYYNEARTHLSLSKDAPVSRGVQAVGRILCLPILGGLY